MVDVKENAEQSEAVDSQTESSTLAAVEAKLAAIQADDNDLPSEPVNDDSQPVNDEVVKEDDGDSEKPDDQTLLLPSGHRRAALARGYTSEEVDYYIETKPEEAATRFEKIFNEWQEENSKWSDRGRQLTGVQPDGGKKADESTVLTPFDAKALIEEHGNEELITALVSPLNATIDRVNAVAERLSKSEEFLRSTEENALLDATQEFLTGEGMKPYRDTYGLEIKDLTDEQAKSRMGLFSEADIIVAGAREHGRDITINEALERAHSIVSQGSRDEAIRQGIRESMSKRTKTTKSSHRQTTSPDGDQQISDEDMVTRTEQRLQALRGK